MAGGDPLLTDVPISPMPPERFRVVLGDRYVEVEDAIARARESFAGRAIWHVNSTAVGGGVAELLHSLLAYARGAGVDVRWVVVGGQPHFFRVTKTLHNRLHGLDGEPLTEEDEREYREVMEANAEELAALVRPGDFVYLHDPQTAGMTERMVEAGAIVIWRCHIGADEPTEIVRSAWSFLRPMLANAHQYVFSRRQYAWEGLDPERIAVIEPSIDAFSPKNEELSKRTVRSILDRIGLSPNGHEPAVFRRQDGSVGRVDRVAAIDQELPVPSDARLVTQVSRWDRLKDPIGVLEGFAGHVSDEDVHLLLVGPMADGVTDDPEGVEVLESVRAAHAALPDDVRSRVHLVSLPMDDQEENAAMVNAIQRRSTVIVQKSLAEGFGLTATEAMWKGRPVVASAVGGLQEQVVDGVTGLLIEDPTDLVAFGRALAELLADEEGIERMGEAAHEHVRRHYLGTRHLMQYVVLLTDLLAERPLSTEAAPSVAPPAS